MIYLKEELEIGNKTQLTNSTIIPYAQTFAKSLLKFT